MADITQLQNSYTIDYPFSFTGGKVGTIDDSDTKVWKNKIITLLSTGTLQRVWYSDYGMDLTSLLFENADTVVESATRGVNELFVAWLPQLELIDVRIGYDPLSGYLSINVSYKLPSGKQDSVKIDTSSLTAAGETIEGM
jgi:phage baseplate assembly protein W